MRIYRVEANGTDFDEYYSLVVVAADEKKSVRNSKKRQPMELRVAKRISGE